MVRKALAPQTGENTGIPTALNADCQKLPVTPCQRLPANRSKYPVPPLRSVPLRGVPVRMMPKSRSVASSSVVASEQVHPCQPPGLDT